MPRYAINLMDLNTYKDQNPIPFMTLLQPKLTEFTVEAEGKQRMDGTAILVREDVTKEAWDATLDIIRNGIGGGTGRMQPVPKHKLRIYESATGNGGWRRI